jgi:hypothetical protein
MKSENGHREHALQLYTPVSQSVRELMGPVLDSVSSKLAPRCRTYLATIFDRSTQVLDNEPKVIMLSAESHRSTSDSSSDINDQATRIEITPSKAYSTLSHLQYVGKRGLDAPSRTVRAGKVFP